MNWIDNSLGLHANALILRAQRAEVLAGNIANADTPRYRAQDIDFKQALGQAMGATNAAAPRTTHARHISSHSQGIQANLVFRESTRIAPDGNTVQPEVEQAAYAENAVKFQASAQFFDGSLRGLRKALKGE